MRMKKSEDVLRAADEADAETMNVLKLQRAPNATFLKPNLQPTLKNLDIVPPLL